MTRQVRTVLELKHRRDPDLCASRELLHARGRDSVEAVILSLTFVPTLIMALLLHRLSGHHRRCRWRLKEIGKVREGCFQLQHPTSSDVGLQSLHGL
jgi:hypothetical protein